MRNRFGKLACVLGICVLMTACYNNPDVSTRPPGSGTKAIHSGPQVGPGTTAGGSTAGPQPKPHETTSEAAPATDHATAEHAPEPTPAKAH